MLSGAIDFIVNANEFSNNSLALTLAAGSQFTLVSGDLTDTLTAARVVRDYSGNNHRIQFSADVESESEDGAFGCETTEDLINRNSNNPTSGRIECQGAGSTSLELVIREGTSPFMDLGVDTSGDGSYTAVTVTTENGFDATLNDYSAGRLHGEDTVTPNIEEVIDPAVAPVNSLTLDVSKVIYSELNNRFYVTNEDGVSAINPDDLTIVNSLEMAEQPFAIGISEDGTTLWVGQRFGSLVFPVNTATFEAGAPFDLGGSAPPFERNAYDIEVVPGTTNELVVAMFGTDGIIAYRDGVELPNTLGSSIGRSMSIEFIGPNLLLGSGNSDSGSDSGFRVAYGSDGVTLVDRIGGFGSGTAGEHFRDSQYIYRNDGSIFSIDDVEVVGRLAQREYDNTTFSHWDDGVIDEESGTAYLFNSVGPDSINVYDTSTLRQTGAYLAETDATFARDLFIISGRRLVIGSTDGLHLLSLDDLAPNRIDTPCLTKDLSGLRREGLYIELECRFNNVVYNATRNVVYASVAGRESYGNTLFTINPENGVVIDTTWVGAEPTQLLMSNDDSVLYVVLAGASRLLALDPVTLTEVSDLNYPAGTLSFGPGVGSPPRGGSAAVSSVNTNDFLLNYRFGGLQFYPNAMPVENLSGSGSSQFDQVYFSSNPSLGFAYQFGEIFVLGLDSNGVEEVDSIDNAITGRQAKFVNGILHGSDGRRFDTSLLTATDGCELPFEGRFGSVEPGSTTNTAYYFSKEPFAELVVCDFDTLVASEPVFFNNIFLQDESVLDVIEAGPDRLLLLTNRKLILVNPTEL